MARTMTILLHCDMCGREQPEIMVDPDDFLAWRRGKLVQDAMPYLDDSEREMLITQTCPLCFDYLFGDEEF